MKTNAFKSSSVKVFFALFSIPESAKKSQVDNLVQQQDSFSQQVVEAFTQSLHQVFMISSVLMVMAFALVFFVREKPLRDTKSTLTAE